MKIWGSYGMQPFKEHAVHRLIFQSIHLEKEIVK